MKKKMAISKTGETITFEQWKAKQEGDPYGECCFNFAEAWADALEAKMASGARLEAVAWDVFREVDNRPGFGITGFMYGMVVSILAQTWEHGEELRKWSNLRTQVRREGEEANKREGAVLNPALVTIGPKPS